MTKVVFNTAIIVIAAGLGLGMGFMFRAKARGITTSAAKPQSKAPEPRLKSRQQIKTQLNDSSPLATKLERDLSMSTGVTRWLYWLDALEKATVQDFPRLARLAHSNPTALRFVAARWNWTLKTCLIRFSRGWAAIMDFP